MNNIGKQVNITQDREYLASIGICDEEIIGFKGIIQEEYDGYSRLLVRLQYSFSPEIKESYILIHNDKFEIPKK